MKSKEIFAKLALLLATIIWGSSFFIMKNTVQEIDTFYLLAIRFSIAAAILSLFFIKKLRLLDKAYLYKGTIMGVLLFCAYTFQTTGLKSTTPGKNAFLTTVYCIMVPFLYWAYVKIRPGIHNILASLICVVGIGFVSYNGSLVMGLGDALTLVGGLFYAMHIVAVAKFSQGRDIFLLTIIQFASAGVLGWVFGVCFNTFPSSISAETYFSLFYLCFFATAIALLLQNVGQKYTHASTASIILSLESVFGVLFSIIFYHEILTTKITIGFVLIFLAIIISETKMSFLKRYKER